MNNVAHGNANQPNEIETRLLPKQARMIANFLNRWTLRRFGSIWKFGVSPHFLHKDTSDARGVGYVLTVRRLGSTLPASTCALERADIAVARP